MLLPTERLGQRVAFAEAVVGFRLFLLGTVLAWLQYGSPLHGSDYDAGPSIHFPLSGAVI